MPKDVLYFVYILSNRSRILYIGVTNSLVRRVQEHREGKGSAFTSRYRVHHLVYYESFQYVGDAIRRETEIKGWLRNKKKALIESLNPEWRDLYEDFSKTFRYESLPGD